MSKRIVKKVGKRVFSFSGDHWFAAAFLVEFPAILGLVANYAPYEESTGGALFSSIVCIVSIVFGLISFVLVAGNFRLSKDYYQFYKAFVRNRKQCCFTEEKGYLEKISLNEHSDLVTVNPNAEKSNPFESPMSRYSPARRVAEWGRVIEDSLSEIYGIQRENIEISVMAKLPEKDNDSWFYIYHNDFSRRDSQRRITAAPNSALRAVMGNETGRVFYASKQTAYENREYYPNYDEVCKRIEGSIYSRNISIYSGGSQSGEKLLDLVFTVSTFRQSFSSGSVKMDRLLSYFISVENEIKLEVTRYFILQEIGLIDFDRVVERLSREQ